MGKRSVLSTGMVLLAACGGSSATNDMTIAAPPDLAMVATCTSDGQPVALAAHYGIQAKLNVNVKVPAGCTSDACLLDKDAKAGILLLADITQNGTSATVSARPCTIDIPPVALNGKPQPPPTQLTASDTLVQSVSAVMATSTLDGANTCAGLSSAPLAIVLGAHLKAPATDPLPLFTASGVKLCDGMASSLCDQTSDFGCICDQEEDGKPGATVGATGVPALSDVDEVYLALRTVFSMKGTVWPASAGQATPGQRIKGTIASLTLEQSPVGCHRSGNGGMDCDATTTTSVAGLNPQVTQSMNSDSIFVAMPVAEGTTCAQLEAAAGALFAGQ